MFSGKEKLLFRILHLTIIPCKAFGEMHGVKEALFPSKKPRDARDVLQCNY